MLSSLRRPSMMMMIVYWYLFSNHYTREQPYSHSGTMNGGCAEWNGRGENE